MKEKYSFTAKSWWTAILTLPLVFALWAVYAAILWGLYLLIAAAMIVIMPLAWLLRKLVFRKGRIAWHLAEIASCTPEVLDLGKGVWRATRWEFRDNRRPKGSDGESQRGDAQPQSKGPGPVRFYQHIRPLGAA